MPDPARTPQTHRINVPATLVPADLVDELGPLPELRGGLTSAEILKQVIGFDAAVLRDIIADEAARVARCF
jgi:hypothetical protein